jgi:hypothetical protein
MPGKNSKANARFFYDIRKKEKDDKMTTPTTVNVQTEEETKNHRGWWIAIAVLVVLGLLIGSFFVGRGNKVTTTLVVTPTVNEVAQLQSTIASLLQQNPTEAPTAAPTEALTAAPTEPPVVATEAPAPVAVSCNTPSIKAGLNAADIEFGEYLDTNLGKRMTFTSRKVIVPAKAWNDPLTESELKSVENTWLFMQVCIPEGTTGRIFASGFEQGVNRFENGVLLTLNSGIYEFRMRNGEVVIWYPGQESFSSKDLVRIVEQIKVGNFDIKSPLAFFGVTTDLLPSIPDALVKERNVQIIPFPEPSAQ